MKSLADILLAPHQREAVIEDAVKLIEAHVDGRGGLRCVTLKTGLTMLKAARPGLLARAVERLLPEFAQALNPLYQEFRGSPDRDFSVFLQKHSGRAGMALLAVADARVLQASATVQTTYNRMRGLAAAEVDAAMPALSRLLRGYLD